MTEIAFSHLEYWKGKYKLKCLTHNGCLWDYVLISFSAINICLKKWMHIGPVQEASKTRQWIFLRNEQISFWCQPSVFTFALLCTQNSPLFSVHIFIKLFYSNAIRINQRALNFVYKEASTNIQLFFAVSKVPLLLGGSIFSVFDPSGGCFIIVPVRETF